MSLTTLTVDDLRTDENLAHQVSGFWDFSQNKRISQVVGWDETRNYVYATDATHTSAKDNPWKNKTTRPKLTWLYDKALTTYVRKLLPNDEFFRWKSSPKQNKKEKAGLVQHWMVHKLRHPLVHFRATVAKCLGDWLLTGNTFCGVEYIKRYETNLITEERELVFKGARPYRISPWDGVLDASAATWEDSHFAHRRLVNKTEFFAFVEDNPGLYKQEAVDNIKSSHSKRFGDDVIDYIKEKNRNIEGISILDQWESGFVELLEYYGSVHNVEDNTYESNMHIVIADRSFVLINRKNPSYLVDKPVVFASFRKRPENLWGMGPLENLVGLQYRIDHLENVKSDALDACAYPIRKITGDSSSENYELKPGAKWHVPINGDIELLYPDPRIAIFEQDIIGLEREMEEFAGLPRETAGFRTPGEKTGFEVQSLLASAGEFPDEKLAEFESAFLEPLLNLLLELNMRNIDSFDVESIPPGDLNAWQELTIQDLKIDGRLFPIGIKHSKERAEKMQKVIQLIQLGGEFAPEHISKFRAMSSLEEESNLEEDRIIEFGVGLKEQAALSKMSAQLEQQEQERNPDASSSQVRSAGGRPTPQQ